MKKEYPTSKIKQIDTILARDNDYIVIQKEQLQNLLISDFRYSIGRRTTAPSDCVLRLKRYWHLMENWQREQIIDRIKDAINWKKAGDKCDVEVWSEIVEYNEKCK